MDGPPPQRSIGASTSEGDRLLAELLRFIALLREVGLAVGTGQALDAVRTFTLLDLSVQEDVYNALRAVLLDTHAHEQVFAAAFQEFWRGLVLTIDRHGSVPVGYAPAAGAPPRDQPEGATGRGALVLAGDPAGGDDGQASSSDQQETRTVAYSAVEALRRKDFAHLTARELAEMRRLLAHLAFTPPPRRLRRSSAATSGPLLDLRRVARRNLRYGGEVLVLPRRRRKHRPRPLVLICDVSGSMDQYTRLLLRFLHATTQGLDAVETFVFGTRLTRITHQLRSRDPDRALDEVSRHVLDFAGGTRIGDSIATFNRRWARRALGRGAIVVIISDGWDRGDPALLAAEMAHLQRSSHQLVWLNPLLGLEGYQPLTRGMSAALPFVDLFLPAHNLASLEALAAMMDRLSAGRHSLAARRAV